LWFFDIARPTILRLGEHGKVYPVNTPSGNIRYDKDEQKKLIEMKIDEHTPDNFTIIYARVLAKNKKMQPILIGK